MPYYCAQDYEKIRSVYDAVWSKFTVKIRIPVSIDMERNNKLISMEWIIHLMYTIVVQLFTSTIFILLLWFNTSERRVSLMCYNINNFTDLFSCRWSMSSWSSRWLSRSGWWSSCTEKKMVWLPNQRGFRRLKKDFVLAAKLKNGFVLATKPF
jgi:hypothetical protein